MAGEIQLDVITPEAVKYSGTASIVQLPGALGEMGILPSHAPLVSLLAPGVVGIKGPQGNVQIAVGEGFATIANNSVVCLVDAAALVAEVNGDEVRERQRVLERELAQGGSGLERARSEMAYLHAQLRLTGA